MKTEKEVHDKIHAYMSKIDELRMLKLYHDSETLARKKEEYCNIIDALLWVVEDESGKPI